MTNLNHFQLSSDTLRDPTSPTTDQGAGSEASKASLAEDVLIIVPVANVVLFPGSIISVSVGREGPLAALHEAARSNRKLGLLLQREADQENPGPADLYRIGTIANVLHYAQSQDGSRHIICQGERRFRAVDFITGLPFLLARIETIRESSSTDKEIQARLYYLQQQAIEALRLLPQAPAELINAIQSSTEASALADVIAGFIDLKATEKQALLETFDVRERLDKVVAALNHRIEVLKLTKQIDQQTKQSMDNRQREFLLREQLKTIQKALGEDAPEGDLEQVEQAIQEAHMPSDVEQQARKELARLRRMPEATGEHGMVRSYLDWLTGLPWAKRDEENIDIAKARDILDQDHYGLTKVKQRIVEYLAVRKLNSEGRSPILCLVGPPGVGKTSLGQSIARALGLQFVRASLGGVHDEAEIRGHRRTYMGSLPGNIIQSMHKAGTRNPVFMLDEMDKLGASFHGDPAAALLEVLDPEQNSTFRDTYLGVPFDLSNVLFIGTANVLDNIPGPLRDRMEVIELPGYSEEEKVEIARRYLVPRQLKANGLTADQASVSDGALAAIVQDYTREAGCRTLERQIGAVLRRAAMHISEGTAQTVTVDRKDLGSILGPRKFESEAALRAGIAGVATGLAWTPVGGDILFIETSRVPGSGRLILTGQLGDVMKESAQAALSLVKGRAEGLGIDPTVFEHRDIHLHVPAGAIPKDGPSAGVAMFMSLVSLLLDEAVAHTVAMTGEISLRGLVLPVGGIKEKVLAAHRAGIKTVLLPARNRKDLEEIPASAREQLRFIWLDTVDDALQAALPTLSSSSAWA